MSRTSTRIRIGAITTHQALSLFNRGDSSRVVAAICQVRGVLSSLQNNLAATQNQLGLWEDAVGSTTAVLALDAGNLKALFRRGVAYYNLRRFDAAKADLSCVCRSRSG